MAASGTKIYVGCGLTNAPETFKGEVEAFKAVLRGEYEVFDFLGISAGTAADVYRWDIEHCVADCDLLVGVCDYPSIGLGWELSTAVSLNKPTLGLAHENAMVTRLVLGAAAVEPNFGFRRYTDLVEDGPEFVHDALLLARNTLAVPQGVISAPSPET